MKEIIMKILEQNNGLCMDVPGERKRLCKKLIEALSTHGGAIASLRHGALACRRNNCVLVPNSIRLDRDKVEYITVDNANRVPVKDISDLIYYFADMLE